MNDELIQKVIDNAKENFRQGLNCSESVFKAVIDAGMIDLEPEMVRLATGFGGGIGLAGHNCGALVGAVMAVSAAYGRSNPMEGDKEERIKRLNGNPGIYRFFNQIPSEFIEMNGAIDCKEFNRDYDWHDVDRARNCKKLVVSAAELAAKYILSGQNPESFQVPFKENVAGNK
jgi:C_GCAxxG_C_C family probable redox protein